MKLIFKEVSLFNRRIPIIIITWFALAVFAVVAEELRGTINNYLIFKQAFWHVLDKKDLYLLYPNEYYDGYFYGPLFSAVIAPFSLLPNWAGCFLWCLANAGILLYALQRLQLSKEKRLIIIAITVIEMMTSIHNVQINPMISAWIILAYVLVEDEKDFWATLFIAVSFLTKIYGIAALLFFVFSKHKIRFVLSFIFWLIMLVCLPMLYSSPAFIMHSYQRWFETLAEKNRLNIAGSGADQYRDISVMGMFRRISNNQFSNLYVLVPATVCILLPLLRFKQYAQQYFRLSYLAIVLITVIIYSSGAESATYVVAVAGVGIWYILLYQQKNRWVHILLAFVFLLTILSPTDLCPAYLKDHFIRPYSLKALPCFVVWMWLIATVAFSNLRDEQAGLASAEAK